MRRTRRPQMFRIRSAARHRRKDGDFLVIGNDGVTIGGFAVDPDATVRHHSPELRPQRGDCIVE